MPMDIIQRRRIERRRELLAESIKEARADYARGEVTRGTADDLMKEIAEVADPYDKQVLRFAQDDHVK